MRYNEHLSQDLQALCESKGFDGITIADALDWLFDEHGIRIYILNDWHNPLCKWDFRYWLYSPCDGTKCGGIVLAKAEYNIPTWIEAAERAIKEGAIRA